MAEFRDSELDLGRSYGTRRMEFSKLEVIAYSDSPIRRQLNLQGALPQCEGWLRFEVTNFPIEDI